MKRFVTGRALHLFAGVNKKFIYLLLISFLFTVSSNAKAVLYDGRDGLNSNDIRVIAKDSRGLMWIGTYNGLNIYDGYTFTKMPGPLSKTHITSLVFNAKDNELLAGTSSGLYRINPDNLQTTKLLPIRKEDKLWANQRVSTIYVDAAAHEVYIAFGNGYIGRANNNHKLELICRLNDTSANITNILPGRNANELLVNTGNVFAINIKERTQQPLTMFNNLSPINSIYRSGNILLLNGYSSGLSIYDANSFTNIMRTVLWHNMAHPFPQNVRHTLLQNNRMYLLGDNYTFNIIDLKKGTLNEISEKYPDILEGKVYHSLFVDEDDIIWIATNKGLIKIEDRPYIFTRELNNLPARVSTRKMLEDENGDIYVASYSGLWCLSKQDNTWRNYNINPEAVNRANPDAFTKPVQPLALHFQQGSNYIYIGFDAPHLIRFDKKKKAFEKIAYKESGNGDKPLGIYTITEDADGVLWLGGGNGLASFNPVTKIFTLHRNDAFEIGKSRVRYFYPDREKNLLYVASTSGLYCIDTRKGLINSWNTGTKPALSNNDVLFVDMDKDGALWLGTNGGGINIISPDRKKIQYIRKQDGLSNEIVYGIIPQDENNLWISTFNGLDRYRKKQASFSNYFEEDGLSSNEFNQNSLLKTSDGRIFFGSINGITTFYPQQFDPPHPFRIFISGISKWNSQTQTVQLLRNNVNTNEVIRKRPSDLLVELHFAGTDYSDPLRNSFSYRIKELSDNWIVLEDRHTLNLGALPYGDYTVEAKMINSRGVSSANILKLHIKVTQPFYKTWWFFVLILLGLALIFYAAYQLQYQGFKKILHLRMKIASNLHDEVGSLLTRITMFSDNLRYGKNTEEQRNAKLEKIAALSRNATTSMSDVLWTIDSRNDFAGNLLDRMREHAEEMLFPIGTDVNFVVSGTDLKQPITSDTRGEIYLIFKEAINNIVKHSTATKVEILYQIDDKNFLLKITNNNAKAEISDLSTGQGLSNMKMRANKIGAHIHVEKRGDQFTVEISN